jgi:glycosyltransferase involved in cell wall biosynthesis
MANTLETGGTERQFVTISHALRSGEFEVKLGCLRRIGAFAEDLQDIAEFPPAGSLFKLRSQRARLGLARYLRQHGVAVAHAFDFYTNLMLIPAARMARVPVVVGSHRQLGDLLTPMQFRVQKAVFALCNRVVCNSRAAADRLRLSGIPEAKVTVIANGLPEEAFAETAPTQARVRGKVRVGMIARMNDRSKNHATFLRVAAAVSSRCPEAEFVFVGDGPLRAEIEKAAAKLGLSSRAIFLGDRRDIPALLAGLDISVVPSSSESLSNVVLESMAAGVPVIATRVGGNPEIVFDGETGCLVCPDEEAEFAAAVERLVTDAEMRIKIGRQAREYARAHFRVDGICTQYEQLYRSLLTEKGWQLGATMQQHSVQS